MRNNCQACCTSTSVLNRKCFAGGNPGHRQALAQVWKVVYGCTSYQVRKGLHRSPVNKAEMIAISDAELYRAFQREFPENLSRTTERDLSEYDLDRIEVEKLVGKRWESIHADLLHEMFDIASWLNPRAFHYFFPAFIKQSQVDVENTSLLVNSLIDMLANAGIHWPESLKHNESALLKENPEIAEAIEFINEKKLTAWRQERWKLFTEQQWEIVRKWLNWINQDERCDVNRDVLRYAIKNAESLQKQASC